MSKESIEYKYVSVKVGEDATIKNNILASPVLMSSGEANFVNGFLETNDSPNRYKLLSENTPVDDNL